MFTIYWSVTNKLEHCPKRTTDMYSMYPWMHVYVCQTKSIHSQRGNSERSTIPLAGATKNMFLTLYPLCGCNLYNASSSAFSSLLNVDVSISCATSCESVSTFPSLDHWYTMHFCKTPLIIIPQFRQSRENNEDHGLLQQHHLHTHESVSMCDRIDVMWKVSF